MTEIIIKSGNVKIEITDEDLVEVNETPDGMSFTLKGGLQVLYSNPYMQNNNKQIIKNTADHIRGKRLVLKLDDPKRPATVEGN